MGEFGYDTLGINTHRYSFLIEKCTWYWIYMLIMKGMINRYFKRKMIFNKFSNYYV